MPFPTIYRKQSPAIASYDFVDFNTGTGVKNFYAAVASADDIVSRSLISFQPYSQPIATTQSKSDSAGVREKLHDLDFDAVFNRSVIVDGPAKISVPHGIAAGGSGTHTYTSQIQAYVIKVVGSTETTLVKASGNILVAANTTAAQENMALIDVDIPNTAFAIGDTLRLTIENWCSVQGGASARNFTVAHDPQNRAFSGYTDVARNLIFAVPFKITQ